MNKMNNKNKSDDTMTFKWVSPIHDKIVSDKIDKSSREIELADKLLKGEVANEDSQILVDDYGVRILNMTGDRDWFSKHVFFVFSIGRIYDNDDRELMRDVMHTFENKHDRTAFLMNYTEVFTYDNEFIKQIEKQLIIGNGNYHVLLVPYVKATHDELLQAPDKMFSFNGPVSKFIKWNDIIEFMTMIIAKYGVICEITSQTNEEQKKQYAKTRSNYKNNAIGNRPNDISFTMNMTIDPNIQESIDKEHEFLETRDENFKKRSRINKTIKHRTVDLTKHRNKSLLSRIQSDKVVNMTLPNGHEKGVELRMNSLHTIKPKEEKHKYEIYDTEDGFYGESSGMNSSLMDVIAMRQDIQQNQK
jgi:hypothetical protein